MIVDVIFVAWERYEMSRFSFMQLLANTDWSLVRTLHVYDNGSEDGTRELLLDLIGTYEGDLDIEFHDGVCSGPVECMNHYIDWQAGLDEPSDAFAKIDNDIVMPDGWLYILTHVLEQDRVDVLGVECGRISLPMSGLAGVAYTSEHARWIGGVGLIRTEALGTKPAIRADGRFGWTEMQREYRNMNIRWLSPDLAMSELTRIPFEPWLSLSDQYRKIEHERGELERDWPRYHEMFSAPYWEWWSDVEHVVPDPEKDARIERWQK